MENQVFELSAFSEYMDDLNYSEGFYVTPGRDGSVIIGGIKSVREYSGDYYRKAERAARFAVEEHNNKILGEKGSLKFVKIVNLNVEPTAGAIYYITMAVADDVSGEMSHYQAKVWEKINTGFKVHIFRPAPYWLKYSDKAANNFCGIGINNLMPWMNESYLYYKCFFRIHKELLGVEINQTEGNKGVLWFKNCAESGNMLKKYIGRMMPRTNNLFNFDLGTCPNFLI